MRGGARPGAGRPRKMQEPKNASFETARSTEDRARVYLTSLEPKKEVTSWDRRLLVEAGRWAVNNHGPAARIVRGSARFAVGNGLVPQAQTEDYKWNREAEMFFEDRYCSASWAFDRSGQFDFYTAQTAIIESVLTDGEVFAQLVRSENGNPMIALLTSDAVRNDYARTENVIDGVRINRDNRPLSYIFNSPDQQPAVEVPASDVIHVYRPHRIGALRGVSWLGTAVNRFKDMREMFELEISSIRMNQKIALTIESEGGEIGLGKSRNRELADGTAVKVEDMISGVGVFKLNKGEKVVAHEFNRPNSNFQAFIEMLSRECAYSVGVSPEIIWNMNGLGGTASRQALIDADVFFGSIRLLLETRFCARFWRYAIWHAIKSGELPYPGDDWHRCAWVGPQKLTVDNGRDGRLRLELVRAGLLSRRQYFNELGQDSDQQTEDVIRDAARRKKAIERIAMEEGVTLTELEVFPPAPGAPAPVEAVEQEEPPAPKPNKKAE
jgi:lambda family phage portal protein